MNKNGKATLKSIKESMKDSHREVPNILWRIKQVEKDYAERIANADDYMKEYYEKSLRSAIQGVYSMWGGDAHYYLIYKDGSCVCTADDELISGDKMPKLTDIVYAHYQDGYVEMDTESGELHFYEGDDPDYEAEDERKEAYMDAIEIKYGTEYGKRRAAQGYGVA